MNPYGTLQKRHKLSDCVILFIKTPFISRRQETQTRQSFLSFSPLRPLFANLSPLGGTVNAPLAVLIVGGVIILPSADYSRGLA